MSDTLVFDIETQNFFTDPGVGWDNFEALRISVVGVYSYARNEYLTFEEQQMQELADLFGSCARLVGFSMNRYDVPVLQCYFNRTQHGNVRLWDKDRVDLLEEIEVASGGRISLSRVAEANLGVGKTRHGSEAIGLYREGRMAELKEYCLNDVRLTKDLYEKMKKEGWLFIPDKQTGELVKVELRPIYAPVATLF